MPLSEFDLIREYFLSRLSSRHDVLLGVGDDAAILQPPEGMALAVAMDTLVEGVHFDHHSGPYALGWKAAAVNLSDLAACGAEPAWATLSLTIPQSNASWLQAFSEGLFDILSRYDVQLVGGDTCRGPMSVTLELHGFVPANQVLLRSGARVGDKVYLTGPVGLAGLALWGRQHGVDLYAEAAQSLYKALDCPEPQVEAGMHLRTVATSAIDISDGLIADLGHICALSKVGAVIDVDALPRDPDFELCKADLLAQHKITADALLALQLTAGDDYQLCLTVPPDQQQYIDNIAGLHCIGAIDDQEGVRCVDTQGRDYVVRTTGYDHFL